MTTLCDYNNHVLCCEECACSCHEVEVVKSATPQREKLALVIKITDARSRR